MGATWYEANWKDNETHEFNRWWLQYYGNAEEYKDPKEYDVRKAFALAGWLASRGELK